MMPTGTESFVKRFRRIADELAALYGAPVWLVGGALTDEQPRDWDIRVVLSDADFLRFFGPRVVPDGGWDGMTTLDQEWRALAEGLKRSRVLYSLLGLRIDFQLQSEHIARLHEKDPRVRLDAAPEWVLNAGLK